MDSGGAWDIRANIQSSTERLWLANQVISLGLTFGRRNYDFRPVDPFRHDTDRGGD